MGPSPQVSVVLPAYNVEATLRPAMGSVLQERAVPLELIVVDDGSTDSTAQVAAAVEDDRVRVISRPNGGIAAACNTGIREAVGEYVAFQDADDEWLPGKLVSQVDLLRKAPEVGAVFCNAYNRDVVRGTTELLFEQLWAVVADLPKRRIGRDQVVIDGDIRPHLVRRNFIMRPTMLVRSAVLMSFGGFDEELRGTDDAHLWFRMGAEVRFAYLETPYFLRVKGPVSMSRRSPEWFTQVVRMLKKLRAIAVEDPSARDLLPLIEKRLARTHRSLIKSQVKRWQWFAAARSFRAGLAYGFDPVSALFWLAGVAGPVPFKVGSWLKRRAARAAGRD